jgi:hypothetical protein
MQERKNMTFIPSHEGDGFQPNFLIQQLSSAKFSCFAFDSQQVWRCTGVVEEC